MTYKETIIRDITLLAMLDSHDMRSVGYDTLMRLYKGDNNKPDIVYNDYTLTINHPLLPHEIIFKHAYNSETTIITLSNKVIYDKDDSIYRWCEHFMDYYKRTGTVLDDILHIRNTDIIQTIIDKVDKL